MNNSTQFSVSATVDAAGVLTGSICCSQTLNSEWTYVFYLMLDGKTIDKAFSSTNVHSWHLVQDGIYVVQGYIKGPASPSDFRRSYPVEYFTADFLNEYLQFSKLKGNFALRNNPPLEFYKQSEPFQDLAIISLTDGALNRADQAIDASIDLGMRVHELSRIGQYSNFLLSQHGLTCADISEIAPHSSPLRACFSGVAKSCNSLVLGQRDLSSEKLLKGLKGAIGCFSCVDTSEGRITLHSDFFGFNRFFFYQTADIFVASNRYHLLLILLQKIGISIKLNFEKVVAGFSSVRAQILLQNFSRKMDVEGVYQLERDRDFELTEAGWRRTENSFSKVLHTPYVRHIDDYSARLREAKTEIVENISVVLRSPQVSRAVVDLTGGLDSRLVYAALTNLDENLEKVQINSYDVPGSEDLKVALQLNSLYKFPYNDTPTLRTLHTIQDSDQMMRSYYMGTYFSHNMMRGCNEQSGAIQMNGACGEILCRPYISRNFFQTPVSYAESLPEFVHALTTHMSDLIITDYTKAYKYFPELLMEELSEQPVTDNFEALDRIYLMYRHGYHFDGSISYKHNGLGWMPLQSKTLFKLHHQTYPYWHNIKLQLDMLHVTNPILAALPYENNRDNQDKLALKEILNNRDPVYSNVHMNPVVDRNEWEAACKRKAASTTYTNKDKVSYRSDPPDYVYDGLLIGLYKLVNLGEGEFSKAFGPALYHYVRKNRDNSRVIRTLYNRVLSIVDQAEILNMI